ncbi:MAG: hypothetical protein Q8N81_03540 [bacterium]|nr:hypothetical protein [bacterium]
MSTESEPFGAASLNRRDDPDEFGMTASQFDKSQTELRRTVDAMAGAEREKSHQEYYIFDTPLEKERAAKLVVECRQYEDAFRYLADWHDDKIHSDIGLGLEFSKSPPDSEAKVADFFSRNNLQAKRIHHIDSQLHETAVYAKDPEAEQRELGQQAKVLPFSRMRKTPSKQAPEEEIYTRAA